MQYKLTEQLRYIGDAMHLVEIINTLHLCAEKLLKVYIPAARINWSKFSACILPYAESPKSSLTSIAG